MELRQEIKQRLRTARNWPGLIEELIGAGKVNTTW